MTLASGIHADHEFRGQLTESTVGAHPAKVIPFRPRIVQPDPKERYVTCVPLVPLKIAAGAFSDPQHIDDDGFEWTAIEARHGERYTVKSYESKKAQDGDLWHHTTITLNPVNPDLKPIVLTSADEGQLQVVAEFVEVLGGGS